MSRDGDYLEIYASGNECISEVRVEVSQEKLRELWEEATIDTGYCITGCGRKIHTGQQICSACFLDALSGYKQELWQDIAEAVEGD